MRYFYKPLYSYVAAAALILSMSGLHSCSHTRKSSGSINTVLKPLYITDTTEFDTDDPAIWVNPKDKMQSLIVGTDKEEGGGIYAFDLKGKTVKKVTGLKRPNNVDVAYHVKYKNGTVDVAIFTERKANTIRVFSLPDLQPIDNGGIPVFETDTCAGCRDGMGIAIYTAPDGKIYAMVGRKTGPSGSYIWQYELKQSKEGFITADVVRKFGTYSGKKEIESIAVDNELGYVYYSDEQVGVRKYYADPAKGNQELALLATSGFTDDHEGISIYKSTATTGYILVSNQQDNSFMIYPREGMPGKVNEHPLITKVRTSTLESDGSDVTSLSFGRLYPKGFFVAMSNGKVFQIYDWRDIQAKIDVFKK